MGSAWAMAPGLGLVPLLSTGPDATPWALPWEIPPSQPVKKSRESREPGQQENPPGGFTSEEAPTL